MDVPSDPAVPVGHPPRQQTGKLGMLWSSWGEHRYAQGIAYVRRGLLQRLYAILRLPPFGAPRIRAVKKEQKHYHYDWSVVPGEPARFENLVACHLLKWVHFKQDALGRDVELRYFRDTDGREVDFVVVERRAPLPIVEGKWSDADVDRSLRDLKAPFPGADAWQVSMTGAKDYVSPEGIRVAPALALLRGLT